MYRDKAFNNYDLTIRCVISQYSYNISAFIQSHFMFYYGLPHLSPTYLCDKLPFEFDKR